MRSDPQNRVKASENKQYYGGFANPPPDQKQIKPLGDPPIQSSSDIGGDSQAEAASLQQVDPATDVRISSTSFRLRVEPPQTTIYANCLQHSIYVLGSVAVDLSCDYTPLKEAGAKTTSGSPQLHTSNIATIVPSIGGVGHNVALAAHLASGDASVQLRSFVADDL